MHLLVLEAQFMQIIQFEDISLCSDGTQKGPQAAFAWVMATSEGTRIAQCSGPCFGKDPTSYRAEGYGILSALRFFTQLRRVFNTNFQNLALYCDNQTMVNRSQQPPRDLDRIVPNETLAAEWDLLMEIWSARDAFPPESRPSLTHVKGHQDKKTPYNDLPLRAQLNVDADRLADQYLETNPDLNCIRTSMFPTTRALIHTSTGTITYKLKRKLRECRTRPPLVQKLRTDYGWDDDTFRDINWEASRVALTRLRHHKTTMHKHINKCTPVGKLVNRYDPKYPAGCPSCDEPIETREHLYQCGSARRQSWRGTFISELRQHLEKSNTGLDIQILLLEGVKAVLEGRTTDTMQVPASVADLAVAQESIGWEEMLKGRFSSRWSRRQQAHMGAFNPKANGETWLTSVIQFILEQWFKVWEIRNEDRHGRDQQTKAQLRRDQALRELEQLYTYQGEVLPRHNWILQIPLDQRQHLKTYTIRAFINCYKPVLEESYKERLATG